MAFLKKGQTSEGVYSYRANSNSNALICIFDPLFHSKYDGINVAAYNYNYYYLNEAQVMYLVDQGPVAVNVAANDWQSYWYTNAIL